MFSSGDKVNFDIINSYGRDCLLIGNQVSVARCRENKKLCFLRCKDNMVLLAVVNGE